MQMVISYITKTYRKTLKLEIYCGIYFADEERIMLPNLVLLLDSDFDCAKSLNTLIPKRFLGLGLGTFAPFCAILRSQTDKINQIANYSLGLYDLRLNKWYLPCHRR